MSQDAALVALRCPSCGAGLEGNADGLFRCPACGVRSTLLQGRPHPIRRVRLAARFDGEATGERLVRSVEAVGTGGAVEKRVADRLYLARPGQLALSKDNPRSLTHRKGVFGVPLAETDGAHLLTLEDATVLSPEDGEVPVGAAAALQHFPFRAQLAARATLACDGVEASWDDAVYVVSVPVASARTEVRQLPGSLGRTWIYVQPDGRYGKAVELFSGGVVEERLPRRVLSPVLTLVLLGSVFTAFTCVVTAPGLVGALVGVLAAVLAPFAEGHLP